MPFITVCLIFLSLLLCVTLNCGSLSSVREVHGSSVTKTLKNVNTWIVIAGLYKLNNSSFSEKLLEGLMMKNTAKAVIHIGKSNSPKYVF